MHGLKKEELLFKINDKESLALWLELDKFAQQQ